METPLNTPLSPEASTTANESVRKPAPLACTLCRKKHLKCDGKQPNCSRCFAASLQCNYTPSRRGLRGASVLFHENGQSVQTQITGSSTPYTQNSQSINTSTLQPIGWTTDTIQSSLSSPISPGQQIRQGEQRQKDMIQPLRQQIYSPNKQIGAGLDSRSAEDASLLLSFSSDVDNEQLINLFYSSFHPAHPVLVPRKRYILQRYPRYLKMVVQYIGNHYSGQPASSNILQSSITAELSDTEIVSPFMVQARLLFSIALHGRHEIQEAQKMLTQSTQLALHLGMHESSFFANESPLEEESWRRTWWEIYVVNGYMSAIWRKSGFNIGKTFSDLPLPCEEAAYLSGSSPTETISLGEFDARLYADEERRFSSFCYRIEAVRILARVLDLNGAQDVQWAHNEVQSVDNALAAWSHHLPPEKVEIINTLGQVDEIMFQAHMIIQYASIYLHFPRSNLQHTIAANADITCGRRDSHVSPTSTPHMHAIKATEASKQLTNLASLRLPVENHSPFFINGLALSGVVQLSACSLHTCDCFHQHRDRVLLILGVLKSMGRIWPFSQLVLQQVKKVAAKVFDIFVQAPMPLPQVSNSASTEQGEMSMGHSSSWLDTLDIQTLQGMMNFDTEMEYTGPI